MQSSYIVNAIFSSYTKNLRDLLMKQQKYWKLDNIT